MNYVAMLQELLTSKKANVAGGAGAVILALPSLMSKLSMNGDPVIAQVLLVCLAACYVIGQAIIDARHDAERVQALRQYAEFAINKGVTAQDLPGLLRQMDQVIEGIIPDPTPAAQPPDAPHPQG